MRTHPTPTRLPAGVMPSCLILTGLSLALAVCSKDPRTAALVGALFAALLTGFFHALGQRHPDLRSLPFRLVESGFVVITLGASLAAIDGILRDPAEAGRIWAMVLRAGGERLGLPILGFALVGFGIVLWVPLLIEAQRQARVELRSSERERSRIETRIIEADRLLTAGELAVGVAHDLRNPLAICRAAAEALVGPSPPTNIGEHVEVIRRNVDRAEQTIAALLTLGRARPSTERPSERPIRRMLRAVTGLVDFEASKRGATIEVDAPKDLRAAIDAEPLQRLLMNLVLNALQAGSQTVTMRALSLRTAGHDSLVLAIEDRGRGLSAAERARLFEPFFTTRSDGVGLGLLSCRRIAGDLGGTIRLYPRRRGGTRAVVLLPRVPPRAEVAT